MASAASRFLGLSFLLRAFCVIALTLALLFLAQRPSNAQDGWYLQAVVRVVEDPLEDLGDTDYNEDPDGQGLNIWAQSYSAPDSMESSLSTLVLEASTEALYRWESNIILISG
jgi:hypothetical protein